MFHTDFLRLVGLHLGLDVEERFHYGASLRVHLFLGDESLSGQAKLIIVLHIHNQKYRSLAVLGEHFIDLGVMRLEGRASGVPTQEFLLLADLLHHGKHGLMEEVIQEPDIRLTGVFLEGNGITINDLDGVADHLA